MSKKYYFYFFFLNIIYINSIKLDDNDFFEPKYKNLIRKIDRLSRDKNYITGINRDIFNYHVDKLRNYIFTHDIKRKEANRTKYDEVYQLKNETNITVDGTYDLFTKEILNFDTGYQVSFETVYDNYTEQEYEELAYKMALMSENTVYLGVFDGNPELSFHFTDIELANVLGIVFDQISIWDWSVMDEIINDFREGE